DYDAIGPTVHLAARMEQMAPPGAIYCTANVMRVAKGFIEALSLGEAAVKGIRHPVELFQITGHTSARTRWEVTAARGLTPFVGRVSESALHDALAALPQGASSYLPALHSLLEIPVEDADWPTLEPAVRRQRMRSTVKDLFLRCAQHRPLLLWFEDMQWTDVETQDVLES